MESEQRQELDDLKNESLTNPDSSESEKPPVVQSLLGYLSIHSLETELIRINDNYLEEMLVNLDYKVNAYCINNLVNMTDPKKIRFHMKYENAIVYNYPEIYRKSFINIFKDKIIIYPDYEFKLLFMFLKNSNYAVLALSYIKKNDLLTDEELIKNSIVLADMDKNLIPRIYYKDGFLKSDSLKLYEHILFDQQDQEEDHPQSRYYSE